MGQGDKLGEHHGIKLKVGNSFGQGYNGAETSSYIVF